MTALMIRPNSPKAWGVMPGWNVVADLTPPELINARWIGVLRRRIVIGLVIVLLLCVAGYVYAMGQYNSASDSADAASADTVALQHSANKYGGITQIETTVKGVDTQVATAMADDVDVMHIVATVRAALPNTMSIQSLTLTLTPAAAGGVATSGLDTSGHTTIGTITMSGSGQSLDDLPTFVDKLAAIKGVVNVLPSSNAVSAGVAQFTLTASLTDQLYSHRFDVTNTGGH